LLEVPHVHGIARFGREPLMMSKLRWKISKTEEKTAKKDTVKNPSFKNA